MGFFFTNFFRWDCRIRASPAHRKCQSKFRSCQICSSYFSWHWNENRSSRSPKAIITVSRLTVSSISVSGYYFFEFWRSCFAPQRPTIDLNKRFLPRPNTTTAWKLIPYRWLKSYTLGTFLPSKMSLNVITGKLFLY